jgi:nodulation protein E
MTAVAITGMGIVSSIGNGIAAFRDALFDCRSGIGVCEGPNQRWAFDRDERMRLLAAPVRDLPAQENARLLPALDPFSRLALIAAAEAIEDAGMATIKGREDRTAVILGTAAGGDVSRDDACYRLFGRKKRPHPLATVRAMVNGAVSALTIEYGLTGPAFTVCSACASATQALGQACCMPECGMADVVLAGGAEALPSYSQYQAWCQMKVLSRDGCRPFAADRNGIVLGEGAGVLVLERLADAVVRGARIHAQIAGFGTSSDASDWTVPDADGILRCMTNSLSNAGIEPRALAYVNAHATGTERGDAIEAQTLLQLLGDETDRIAVSSTKALHGHALGASGALEVIATILALRERRAPPMPEAPRDPAIRLRLVNGDPEWLTGEFALKNSFGFGGLNAAIVLRRAS